LLPPLLFLAAMFMGADFTAICLRPLRVLQIPYPKAMNAAHVIIPACCAAIWLITLRRWPNTGSMVSVVLCFVLIGQIPRYAERRTASIPVRRFLTSAEQDALKSRITFPIFEQASSGRGNEVIVAPANAASAREELQRLRMLPGSDAGQ
jgi:hypothetical protein